MVMATLESSDSREAAAERMLEVANEFLQVPESGLVFLRMAVKELELALGQVLDDIPSLQGEWVAVDLEDVKQAIATLLRVCRSVMLRVHAETGDWERTARLGLACLTWMAIAIQDASRLAREIELLRNPDKE